MTELDYQQELLLLQRRLRLNHEQNLGLLDRFHELAAAARRERSAAAAGALLEIAWVIGERVAPDEDLEPYYHDAVAILEAQTDKAALLAAVDALGGYLFQKDRAAEAEPLFSRVVALQEAGGGATIFSLQNLAAVREELGDLEGSLELRERALILWRDEPPGVGSPVAALFDEARLAVALLLSRLGRQSEAEVLYQEIFDELRSRNAAHPESRWHLSVIEAALDLARCIQRQGRTAEAIQLLTAELSVLEAARAESTAALAARDCYERALDDLQHGREPSQECAPSYRLVSED